MNNPKKRPSQSRWEVRRTFKRSRNDDEQLELFASDYEVEIDDPRNNTPTEIVKTLYHCVTASIPRNQPCRRTDDNYRRVVFDWWDSVKQNGRIGSSLIRSRLLVHLSTKTLKKLGLLEILFDSQCPSAPTANQTNSVRCEEEVNDDSEATGRRGEISNENTVNKDSAIISLLPCDDDALFEEYDDKGD
jgi:hypothetical protein